MRYCNGSENFTNFAFGLNGFSVDLVRAARAEAAKKTAGLQEIKDIETLSVAFRNASQKLQNALPKN